MSQPRPASLGLAFVLAFTLAACAPAVVDVPALGLEGRYFKNADLSGDARVRYDDQIDFDWGDHAPLQLPVDGFSAQWSGALVPTASEVHQLHVVASGRARLTVNGFTVVDHWDAGGEIDESAEVPLVDGKLYPLLLEYANDAGPARVRLSWSAADVDDAVIPTSALLPQMDDSRLEPLGPAWRMGALLVKHTRLTAPAAVVTTMTDAEEQGAVTVARELPMLIRDWSNGAGDATMEIVPVDDLAIESVSPQGETYWVSPEDAAPILAKYAPPGRFDSVFLIWDPDEGNTSVPVCCWYGQGRSRASNDATFASIPNLSDGAWTGPFPAEVLVHEWEHGSTAYYRAERGLSVPDPHDNAAYGFPTADARGSWWQWYAAELGGALVDAVTTSPAGFTPDVWAAGTPTQPVGAVPVPPAGELVAVASGDGVTLTWQAAPGANHYRIFRGTSAGVEQYMNWTPGLTFVDLEAASGTSWFYVVRAVSDALVESADSNEASVRY